MRRVLPREGVLVAAAGLLAAACNPAELDRAVEKAPVRSVRPPDGWPARDIGRVVLPLPVPTDRPEVAARLLVAGTERPSLAVVELDGGGQVRVHKAGAIALEPLAGPNTPLKSAVQLRNGKILIGTPRFGQTETTHARGRAMLLDLVPGAEGALDFRLATTLEGTSEQKRVGLAVAGGFITGAPELEDHVVVSEDQVLVAEDGGDRLLASTCDVTIGAAAESYAFRAVATGDFVEGGTDEVAVGVPLEAGNGRVVVLARAGAALACAVTLTADRRTRFGASIAAGDLDGDGKRNDLVVGSPPDRVFLYTGPFRAAAGGMGGAGGSIGAAAPTPVREITVPAEFSGGPGDFGFRVLVADVDASPGPEIVVSAPEQGVAGKPGAGRVFVYKTDGSLLGTIADNDPAEQASFGFSLGDLRFRAPACPGGLGAPEERSLLVVGAIQEIFTYFRLRGTADPRCFAKAKM